MKAPIERELDLATGMFGHVREEVKERLRSLLECPCEPHWDDAHGILLDGRTMTTLWQSVLAVDPTFPRRGPSEDLAGNRLRGWDRIPDRSLLEEAISYATH